VSAWLGTLQLAAVAAALFAGGGALGVALVHRPLVAGLRRAHPARRATAALALAGAPAAAALLGLALCLAPSLAVLLGLSADHCRTHPEHSHLCLAHPGFAPQPLLSLGLALGAGLAARAGVGAARAAARGRRWQARLAALPAATLGDARVLESESPFCFVSGLLRPRIFLSSAFVRGLSPAELSAALEHERAHARRRDALRLRLARAGAALLPRSLRNRLLAELELAGEEACDDAAARRLGDRLCVAEAILAAERLLAGRAAPPRAAAAGFGEAGVEARVRALLADPVERRRSGAAPLAWASLALLVLAAAEPLHHRTEHLLGLLLR
jgi:Zn-dependent protease with chaperone function